MESQFLLYSVLKKKKVIVEMTASKDWYLRARKKACLGLDLVLGGTDARVNRFDANYSRLLV